MVNFCSHCVLLTALTYALSQAPLRLITHYTPHITHTLNHTGTTAVAGNVRKPLGIAFISLCCGAEWSVSPGPSLSLSQVRLSRGYISILLVSYFMWGGALDSSALQLSYSLTSLASRITIILILISTL